MLTALGSIKPIASVALWGQKRNGKLVLATYPLRRHLEVLRTRIMIISKLIAWVLGGSARFDGWRVAHESP